MASSIKSASLRGASLSNQKKLPGGKEEQRAVRFGGIQYANGPATDMNLSYSGSEIDENELRDEILDDVDIDGLEQRTPLNEFDRMSAGEKLYAIAQRTD